MKATALTPAGHLVGREDVIVELADGSDPATSHPDVAAGRLLRLDTATGTRPARLITAPRGLIDGCRRVDGVILHPSSCWYWDVPGAIVTTAVAA